VTRASAVSDLPTPGASRRLVVAVALIVWSGCSLLQPLQIIYLGDLGHFEYRQSRPNSTHIVVGVPRATSEPASVDYAAAISDRLNAGLVVAYGFDKARIQVAQPLIHNSRISWNTTDRDLRTQVYPEFVKILQTVAGGQLEFYVGVRIADATKQVHRIEVASSGLSFKQLKALKVSYATIRDRLVAGGNVAKIEVAMNPLDDVSWRAFGVKNHGVLALAERGLILRLPNDLVAAKNQRVYREILAEWVGAAISIARRTASEFQEIHIERLHFGRIDSIATRSWPGMVIAAPHGSFDWYTSDLVEQVSYRTAMAAVVTKGFTPTECGGWRIDVNRPTERRYPTDAVERVTDRSHEVYREYSRRVLAMARGALNLYIEMHQNGSEPTIEVATVGISKQQAVAVKNTFEKIRDRALVTRPNIAKIDLAIEPVDRIAIGAWAAKERGLLGLAKRGYHFELPAQKIFYREETRRAYFEILTQLVDRLAKMSVPRQQPAIAGPDSPIHRELSTSGYFTIQ
jgi:hypothetical protein